MQAIGLEARIRRQFDTLPPAERRLAETLLGLADNPAIYTAGELARMAGVSPAAASRLFRRLGYRNYGEVRRELQCAGEWGSPLHRPSASRVGGATDPHRHLLRERRNLERTVARLSPATLAEIGEALAGAGRVQVLGFRNSYWLAGLFARQLGMLRPEVGLLPFAGQTLGEDLVEVDCETVLVVFAFRRRVPVLLRLLAHVAEVGARRLVLTDRTATRTVELASWAVPCEVEGSGPLDSYAAAASVANLLCAATFARLGTAARRRLATAERLHGDLAELDPVPLVRLASHDRGQGRQRR